MYRESVDYVHPRDNFVESLDSLESGSEASLDSEISYAPLFTKREIYEFVTYLSFNIYWIFLSAIATSIRFTLFTYQLFFQETLQNTGVYLFFLVVCNTIFFIDVVASILPRVFKRYAAIRDLPPRSKWLVAIDLLSIIWMIIQETTSISRYFSGIFISAMFFVSRLYRVILYFVAVSSNPGYGSFAVFYRKYGLLFFLMSHICACAFKYLECYKCPNTLSWAMTIDDRVFGTYAISPFDWYIVSIFVAVGGLTSFGSGHIHAMTNTEILLYSFTMLLGFILLDGAFVGAWTSGKMESYRRQSMYAHRLRLITKAMERPEISKNLRKKVRKFYTNFWNEMDGVQTSRLFERLPATFKEQTYLDMYWNALRQTYLLKDLHPAFRRALASVMTTEIYETGELLYERGKPKQKMIYILKGNVQIMSVEDSQSPILTLGIGTCLGEINLVYTVPSLINVRASSYCIVQCLKKEDFWRVNFDYRHLHQTELIRNKVEKKMQNARSSFTEMSDLKENTSRENVSLNSVKNRLKSEKDKSEVDNFSRALRSERPTEQLSQYADLYVLSLKQTVLKHSDEVFLQTTCPLILQPDSIFLQVWEYVLCSVILMVCFIYPFQISFLRRVTSKMLIIDFLVRTFFMLDTGLQFFTAIERDRRLVTNLIDLAALRLQSPSFICDLIAGLPLVSIAVVFNVLEPKSRMAALVNAHRLLKIYRLLRLFDRLDNSFNVNTSLVRCVKYVIYFILIAYFTSCTIYMLACFNPVCVKDSWFDQIEEEDKVSHATRYKQPVALSLYYGALIICMMGYGNATALNMFEIYANLIFPLIARMTFCYLVADYSATLMLSKRPKLSFVETVSVIKKYFVDHDMPQINRMRIDRYLELQWKQNAGFYFQKDHLLYDSPRSINQEVKASQYMTFLTSIPLFQGLEKEIVKLIALECKQIILPPNEVVVYAGDVIRRLYFIEMGHCEVISASTGKTEHVLGPMSHFCDVDMLLEQPGNYNVLTLTNVQITTVEYSHIKHIFALHNLSEQLQWFIAEIKDSFALQRLRVKQGEAEIHFAREESNASWFIYPHRKLHPLNIDYEKGFEDMGVFTIFRGLLLRRSILPDGKFIKIWEVTQIVRIFLMAFYYLFTPILNVYFIRTHLLWVFHTLVVLVDMYVRMHVCYYNKSGVLVTHPRYTAYRYLTTAFATDFFSMLPLAEVIVLFRLNFIQTLEQIAILNVLLPLYRIFGLFAYFEGDILEQRGPTLVIVKSLAVSTLMISAFTNILISITCNKSYDSEGYNIMVPYPGSWITQTQRQMNFNVSEPINMYVASLFWVTSTVLAIDNSDFMAFRIVEMIFVMVAILTGYFMFNYIITVIVSYIAGVDTNLLIYQTRLIATVKYMEQEDIHRTLQKKVIKYYEYVWMRTHGMDSKDILNKCHLALHQDCVLHMYQDTLKLVPIFKAMNAAFYRLVSFQLHQLYFLKNSPIIRLNDIVRDIYIIHRGEVQVLGPDGSLFDTLGRGCMFGNIDKTVHSRSTTTIVTTGRVDVLHLKTTTFYKLVCNYPVVTNRLKSTILEENMPYVNMQKSNVHNPENERRRRRRMGRLSLEFGKSIIVKNISKLISLTIPMMLCSLMSCWITVYHLAWQDDSIAIFVFVYALDLIHLIRIFNEFRIPYYDKIGTLITDPDLIKKRYMSPTRFYKDMVAILPLDVIAFMVPRSSTLYVLTWMRMNRMLMIGNVFQFFNVSYEHLYTSILTREICRLLIYFTLVFHIMLCVLNIFACPRAICPEDSWITEENSKDKNRYIMSMYMLFSMLTINGFSYFSPKKIIELIICMFIMLLGKFVMVLLMGDIAALVQYYSFSLEGYNYLMLTFKKYLENNYIDKPLIYRLMRYVANMWSTGQGRQYPKMLGDAPSYLIEEVKRAAYGKHLLENYVFASCHVDFLRLLIAKLQVENFFENDIICQQGDINDKMYFIHNGIVNVYVVSDVEELTNKLGVMDCFGLVQGLFGYTPHNYTYRAATKVIVVTLNLREWAYLLRYYRASRLDIYTKLKKLVEAKENLNDLRVGSLRDL